MKERKLFYCLDLFFIQASFELAGIISIYPLFSVLSDPTLIQSNKYLSFAYISLGFDNLNIFLILLSGLSFFVILLRTVVSFGTNYAISRFIRIRSHL